MRYYFYISFNLFINILYILIEVAGESCKKTIVDATTWRRMEWYYMQYYQIHVLERSESSWYDDKIV